MIGIYKVTNLINQKVYIGQSDNIEQRWKRHKTRSINNCGKDYNYAFYRAIRKYGLENFLFEVIEECSKDELNQREKYWIKYYNSYLNPDHYNETEGGEGTLGWVPSQEWRDKQSKIKKEWYKTPEGIEKRKKQSEQQKNKTPFKDYTHSLDWKKQHSERMKGENNPAYNTHTNGKRCMCIELYHIFESTREAEKIMGISHIGISAACRGKQETAGGYHWRYINI